MQQVNMQPIADLECAVIEGRFTVVAAQLTQRHRVYAALI